MSPFRLGLVGFFEDKMFVENGLCVNGDNPACGHAGLNGVFLIFEHFI
jgi:hypothetical protein